MRKHIGALLNALVQAGRNGGFIEPVKMHGAVTMTLRREDGSVEVVRKDNIIVSAGFDFIANVIGNSPQPPAMGWIAVGTGTAAPTAADTALGAELTRQAATFSHTPGQPTFTLTTNFGAGVASGAITEAGVLNQASGGILFDHVSFPVVNKGANDTLQCTFTFTMS